MGVNPSTRNAIVSIWVAVILGVKNPLWFAVKSNIELLAGATVPMLTCAIEE